jgi:hypothetical protein
MEPVSLSLEQSLLTLHDSIAVTAPSLLPMVQKLGMQLRNERTLSHRQKIDLLTKFTNSPHIDSTSTTPSSSSRTSYSTPNRAKKIRNKSPSEMRIGRSLVKTRPGTGTSTGTGDDNNRRSRSRSAGSLSGGGGGGGSSVTSNGSLSSQGNKMIFFRRENDF